MEATLMPLDIFREEIGWNPFHFFQIATDASGKLPLTDHCSTLLRQYSWQNTGAAGRVEIASAIKKAEGLLALYLGYSPASHYVSSSIDLPCLVHYGPQQITLPEARVTRIGTEALTLIDDAASIAYSDTDGDGVEDTFTVVLTDSTSDASAIELYFSSGDRTFSSDSGDLEKWQIRPIVATRTGANQITVKGAKWLCVKPNLYEGARYASGYDTGYLDPNTVANFVTTVAVYRRDVTNLNQATLIYNDGCGTETSYTVCAVIRDSASGTIEINGNCCGAAFLPCTCYASYRVWWYKPVTEPLVRLAINYRAGEELAKWKAAITRLALAEMKKKICACEDANAEIYKWQQDMARAGGSLNEQYRIGNSDLENPLGTLRGQIYAWNQIDRRQLYRGFYF